jgi:hypothetical protein
VEFPEPVDYTTDDLFLKAGYQGRAITVGLSGSLSSFDNANKFLNYEDLPNDPTPQTNALAPENDYSKLAADLSWRGLPANSVLALGGSYARLENDFAMSDINFDITNTDHTGGGDFTGTSTTFAGEIDYKTGSVALTSNPFARLDSKIYYIYQDKDDKSNIISYTDAAAEIISNAGALLGYQKRNAGVDLGYRLPFKTKVEAGYEYLDIDRDLWQHFETTPRETTDNAGYIN